MAIGVSANKLEILQIARAVAQEKMIDESIVLEAIEEAIQKAARSRYGAELDIHCKINPKTGEMRLTSRTTVVWRLRSASRTFWVITCLAVWEATRPNSIGGSSSS